MYSTDFVKALEKFIEIKGNMLCISKIATTTFGGDIKIHTTAYTEDGKPLSYIYETKTGNLYRA